MSERMLVDIRPLTIPGAFELTPRTFPDDRGSFLEWFKADLVAETLGYYFPIEQANCSVSRAGVVRGVHFADVPPGQAKYVTCISGSVYDIVVDLRQGSPTFGRWEGVQLDDRDRRAVYLPVGVGHAFMALAEDTTVVYLCSEKYAPTREHGIDPLDADLAIVWPETGADGKPLTVQLSEKDAVAPSFAALRDAGALPTFAAYEAMVEASRIRT